MISGQSFPQPSRFGRNVAIVLVAMIVILGFSTVVRLSIVPAQANLSRDLLWQVVHGLCVPGQSMRHDPIPCVRVNLDGGIEHGFAILRDPRGGTQFILVPTIPVAGIESPVVRSAEATNYFADAWESRTLVSEALHRSVSRDHIGLAINSAVGRSQDQLHIHFSCVRTDVVDTLRKKQPKLEQNWVPFDLLGHTYMARWAPGEHLVQNPFKLLAELPDATKDMGNWTLVVVGLTRMDGTNGFVIFANRFNLDSRDFGMGEEMLDRGCHVVSPSDSQMLPDPSQSTIAETKFAQTTIAQTTIAPATIDKISQRTFTGIIFDSLVFIGFLPGMHVRK